VITLLPARALAVDVALSGALERLLEESIFVRLADGRLIDARLPRTGDLAAGSIAAQYKLADQVQIICKPIQSVYDKKIALYQHLELQKLKRLRSASPEERVQALAFLARKGGANLLKDSGPAPLSDKPATAEALLDHVRQVNLEFAANLPNFVADEIGKRYTAPLTSSAWHSVDTVESEIIFRGGGASREHIRLNGKPWDRPFQDLPGYVWGVFFGTQFRPLFSTDCPTTIEFEGRETAQGRSLLAFRFASPPAACFRLFGKRGKMAPYSPARTGRFLVEDPGGRVVRYEEESTLTEGREMDRWTVEESWEYVKIGDATHLMPVGVKITGRSAEGLWSRVDVAYKNHRHFESSANFVIP
jgi:hypothetical protein